jgi:hypothetical protein
MKNRLKLGLITSSHKIPAWLYRSLERIIGLDIADFSVILLLGSNPEDSAGLKKIKNSRSTLIYDRYSKIDQRLFHLEPDAFKPQNLLDLFPNVPAIEINPIQNDGRRGIAAKDLEKINSYQLDILISEKDPNLGDEILKTSKYGIWAYTHGDPRVIRGMPEGFWEVVENLPETGCILSGMSKDPAKKMILYRSQFFTYPLSPARNRHYIYWASASFLPRQIERLHSLGESAFFEEVSKYNNELDLYDRPKYEIPANFLAIKLSLKMSARILKELLRRFFFPDKWFLLLDLHTGIDTSMYAMKKILPPKDRFWADPHVILKDEKYYIFIEEFIYKKKKGHISVLGIDQYGNRKETVPVLEEDYHLSYPFVFRWEDKYYMIPESAANKTIDLYECVCFPQQWKFVKTLMRNIRALDTTLLYYQQKWWLFTALAEQEGAFPQVELCLFFTDDFLSGEWKPHPLNPIVSDIKNARPAGKIFRWHDKIFRPSQDCSKIYGYGFDLKEIIVLSEEAYLEKTAASVRPFWDKNIQATHTFAREGELTVIDALVKR